MTFDQVIVLIRLSVAGVWGIELLRYIKRVEKLSQADGLFGAFRTTLAAGLPKSG